MANVGTVLINIKARSDSMVKGLKKARMRLRRFRRSINRTFGGLAKMATIAGAALLGSVGLALKKVMDTFAQFEQKMADVRSVVGKTAEGFDKMRSLARKLGESTVFTATESAEAMLLLSRAGFTAKETMSAIVHVMNLAAASGHTLAEMAEVVSTAIRGFGLAAHEAARVADVLALASAKSNTTVHQLGEALSFVAPIARAMGISLEETVAMLGILSDAGLQAERAGTGLRAVLAKLVDEMGPGGLSELLEMLSDSSFTAADAFAKFGRRGAPAILALIAMRDRGVDLHEALKQAIGTTKEMAEVRLDTVQGAFMLLKSAAQELMIVIGERLAPIIRAFAESATVAIRAVGTTLDQMAGSTDNVRIGTLSVVDAFASFIEAIAGVTEFAVRMFHVFRLGFNTVKAMALGTLVPMLEIISAIAEVGYDLLHATGAVSDELHSQVVGTIKGTVEGLRKALDDSKSGAGDAIGEIFGESNVAEKMEEFARRLRGNARKAMVETGQSLGEDVVEGIEAGIQGVAEVMTEEMKALADATEDIQDFIKNTQEAIDTWGMSADQIEIWKAKQKGVSEELLKQAEALMEQKKALEEQQKAMERGKQITEQMRTPSEIYSDTIKELDDLLKRGAITQETFRRAMAKAKEDLEGATEVPEVEIKANISGIDTALGQFTMGMDLGDQIAKKSLNAEEKQVKLLSDIAKGVNNFDLTKVLS